MLEKPPSQVTERAELKVGGSRGEQADVGWFEPRSPAALTGGEGARGRSGDYRKAPLGGLRVGVCSPGSEPSTATQQHSLPTQAPACPLGGLEDTVSQLPPSLL